MSIVVAIGAPEQLLGYGLAGVRIVEAADDEAVRASWAALEPDPGLVLLTAEARRALGRTIERTEALWTVIPG